MANWPYVGMIWLWVSSKTGRIVIMRTNILVFDDCDRCVDEHHVVYTKDGKHLLNCLNTFDEAEYTVRDGVTTICDDAFMWRANQEQRMTLYIPRSVKIIGENIFGDGGGRIIVKQ